MSPSKADRGGTDAGIGIECLGVPPNRVSEIVRRRRGITGDTALRLVRYFGVSAQFWLTRSLFWEPETLKRSKGC